MGGEGGEPSTSYTPIDSSNIGFKLLKKHGWKEGTGLGVSEQGRLQPIQAQLKTNKQGLGAGKVIKKPEQPRKSRNYSEDRENNHVSSGKKAKIMTKRMKKIQEFEKQMQEKEFEQAFFREFWPDNV